MNDFFFHRWFLLSVFSFFRANTTTNEMITKVAQFTNIISCLIDFDRWALSQCQWMSWDITAHTFMIFYWFLIFPTGLRSQQNIIKLVANDIVVQSEFRVEFGSRVSGQILWLWFIQSNIAQSRTWETIFFLELYEYIFSGWPIYIFCFIPFNTNTISNFNSSDSLTT